MKKLLLTIIFMLFAVQGFAQSYHYIYTDSLIYVLNSDASDTLAIIKINASTTDNYVLTFDSATNTWSAEASSGLSAISAWSILLNNSASSALPAGVKISALTDRTAFGAGDKVMIEESTGELRKIDFTDFPGAGGGISNIIEDVTPQLGSDLDANSFDIQFDDATGIRDDSDNEQLIFQKTATAINHFEFTNAAAGGEPLLAVVGGDTDVSLTLDGKGAGTVRTLSSNLNIAGTVTATGSFIIGSADMSEVDLEKLDGITNGAGAANKALVLDASTNIASGVGSFTATTFVGALTGNSDTATLAATLTIADNEAQVETNAVIFTPAGALTGGDLALESDGDFTYTPNTGNLSATQFGGITEANLLDKSATEAITGSWDFGGATQFEIPNGAAPTAPNVAGEIVFDTNAMAATHGAIVGHDGTQVLNFVSTTDTPGDNEVPKFDSGTGKVTWEADVSAGSPVWSDIGDPTNSALHTITFDNAEASLLTGNNDAVVSFFTLQNTDADHTVGQMYLLHLDYSADDGDAEADFIKFEDSGSIVMTIQQNGDIATDGVIGAGGAITAVGSFIIGSADMSEADLEKLDGITDGAGAANKALVLDGSADIVSGLANLTASATITVPTVLAGLLDPAGAVDLDLGSVDVTDVTATTDGGTVVLDGSISTSQGATGSGLLIILEDTDAGSNFASFQVPALAANTAYILPDAFGSSGFQLTDAAGDGVLSWAAASGAAAHDGTITWTGASILESGVAFGFGDGSDATLTHTYANSGTNVTVAYSSALFTFSHGLTLSAGNITQAAGTTLFMGGLLDATGDVDMDYGSADIDDHTFLTDGTGTTEIVLPAGAIDGIEILDGTVTRDDVEAEIITDTFGWTFEDPVSSDNFSAMKLPFAYTITEIACHTNTGTADINVEERAEATPNTAGTDAMSSELVCDSNQQETASFSNAGFAANTWPTLTVSAVASSPTKITITVRYIKD